MSGLQVLHLPLCESCAPVEAKGSCAVHEFYCGGLWGDYSCLLHFMSRHNKQGCRCMRIWNTTHGFSFSIGTSGELSVGADVRNVGGVGVCVLHRLQKPFGVPIECVGGSFDVEVHSNYTVSC